MPMTDDREYLLGREKHARQMAQNASDSLTRNIHTNLADRYAERAHACEADDQAQVDA